MARLSKKSSMKVLVAGGAGYIGSALVPVLLDHGYDVTVIDLLWFGNHLPKGVKVIQKDLLACTDEDYRGFDQVIFLAGLSNDPMAEYNPSANFVYNAALPGLAAFYAKRAGVRRFIFASSCSVYGTTAEGEISTEESPTRSHFPYGVSKLQGEKGVFQFQDDNFSVIALRQGTVCGVSPRMRFDLVVNTMFKTALSEGKIIVSYPQLRRPILAIQDAIQAYRLALQASFALKGIFNIISANYTIGELGHFVRNAMSDLTGLPISSTIQDIPDARSYQVSQGKAKELLKFFPSPDPVRVILQDLFKNHKIFSDFHKKEFYNIEVFKKLHEYKIFHRV